MLDSDHCYRNAGLGVLGSVILIVASILLEPGSLCAQDAAGTPAVADPGDAAVADLYLPPEGTDPQVIRAYLDQLMQMPASDRTPSGLRGHFGKLHSIADNLFARPLDEESALRVVRLKIGALGILDQLGDPGAAKLRNEFITALKNDERPTLASQGQLLDAEMMLGSLRPGDPAGAQQVVDRIIEMLKAGPISDSHLALALGASQALENIGNDKLAVSANRMFSKYLRAAGTPNAKAIADVLEGTARRLDLPGNPVQVTGTTLEGKEFDVANWKGKVVLIDFWATWCGPCVAEMPHLQELYEAHHLQGLEIVGISLDDNIRRLQSFVGLHELPWPILFDERTTGQGGDNPIAAYYGITGIPTMFLVDREGKVAAVNLYGTELDEKIQSLIERPGAAPTKPAAN